MFAQTITTIGIILEGLSVLIVGYEVFFGRAITQLELEGRGYNQRRKLKQFKTAISFLLLTIGLFLQIIGLYVTIQWIHFTDGNT